MAKESKSDINVQLMEMHEVVHEKLEHVKVTGEALHDIEGTLLNIVKKSLNQDTVALAKDLVSKLSVLEAHVSQLGELLVEREHELVPKMQSMNKNAFFDEEDETRSEVDPDSEEDDGDEDLEQTNPRND
jgi:hypothetical protein